MLKQWLGSKQTCIPRGEAAINSVDSVAVGSDECDQPVGVWTRGQYKDNTLTQ